MTPEFKTFGLPTNSDKPYFDAQSERPPQRPSEQTRIRSRPHPAVHLVHNRDLGRAARFLRSFSAPGSYSILEAKRISHLFAAERGVQKREALPGKIAIFQIVDVSLKKVASGRAGGFMMAGPSKGPDRHRRRTHPRAIPGRTSTRRQRMRLKNGRYGGGTYSRNCQTAAASPAQPGDLLRWFSPSSCLIALALACKTAYFFPNHE